MHIKRVVIRPVVKLLNCPELFKLGAVHLSQQLPGHISSRIKEWKSSFVCIVELRKTLAVLCNVVLDPQLHIYTFKEFLYVVNIGYTFKIAKRNVYLPNIMINKELFSWHL